MKYLFMIICLVGLTFGQNVDSLAQARGWIKISPVVSQLKQATVHYFTYDRIFQGDDSAKTYTYGVKFMDADGNVIEQLPVTLSDPSSFKTSDRMKRKNKVILEWDLTELDY